MHFTMHFFLFLFLYSYFLKKFFDTIYILEGIVYFNMFDFWKILFRKSNVCSLLFVVGNSVLHK